MLVVAGIVCPGDMVIGANSVLEEQARIPVPPLDACIRVLGWVTHDGPVPNLIPPGDGLSVFVGEYDEAAFFDFDHTSGTTYWYKMTGYTTNPGIECNPSPDLPCAHRIAPLLVDSVHYTLDTARGHNTTAIRPPAAPVYDSPCYRSG